MNLADLLPVWTSSTTQHGTLLVQTGRDPDAFGGLGIAVELDITNTRTHSW
ncbi:hypothetical protein [Polaromonas sp.]|uniref:hypothetical protein n=1 Tax=Polaromonas sp. TaxID=1869339 RepID=UPI002FCBB916